MKTNTFYRYASWVIGTTVVLLLASTEPARADVLGDVLSAVHGVLAGIVGALTAAVTAAIDALFTALFGAGPVCLGAGQTIGKILCNVLISANTLPGFITALSYLMGVIMAVTGLFKLKDHVLSPSQTPFSDAIKRFVAAGLLFSLPLVTESLQILVAGSGPSDLTVTSYAGKTSGGGGLDTMMAALMLDISVPLMDLLYGFGYIAGLVFAVIGVTRLLNTAQQGPRGPAGIGTIMTFIVAGLLFSSGTLVEAFTGSMFGTSSIKTFAILSTTSGDAAVDDHLLAVISTIIMFMTLVGWISVIRGMFILRDVAEGNGQASLMAAATHMLGGSLAVNLGPLMNAVQSTFGLTPFGVVFS